VAQHVWRDRLGGYRRACRGSRGGVLGKAPLERVTGQRAAGAGREQWVLGLALTFAGPGAQRRDGLSGQRRDALLAALADAADMRAGAEAQVAAGQADQLAGA